jgi:predicted DNA-binding mobile mystery protein A
MKNTKQKLLIVQTDRKMAYYKSAASLPLPSKGWINAVRAALRMSLKQLGNKLHFSAQHIKQLENREVQGSITIKSLREVAHALDMQLVYGFVPKHESLEHMIEERAKVLAEQIVMRTNQTMILEDQQNTDERIQQAIADKTAELKDEIPKFLWD